MVSWSTLSASEMTVMVGQRSSPPGFVGRCASWVKVMNPRPYERRAGAMPIK